MNTVTTYQTSSPSLEGTEQLAAHIGSKLRGREVIVLTSDLGGGKTAFVRGLARGMGSDDHVASPTFTIARQYYSPSRDLTLHHFDFYRLQEPGIMANELAEVLEDPRAVIAIEWGDIVETVLPAQRLDVQIVPSGDTARDFKLVYPEALAYLIPDDSKAINAQPTAVRKA